MPKFTVEGSTLVVRFSFAEMPVSRCRNLRIPLSLVRSVSVDPRPQEWLSQYLKFGRGDALHPGISEHAITGMLPGPAFELPDVTVQGWATYINDDILKVVGPPEARVFARFNPRLPALRVDFTEAAPYIGFLVAHRNPEVAAADLRATIIRGVR